MVTFSLHAALCALLFSLHPGNIPIFAHALTLKLRSARATTHGDNTPAVSPRRRSIASRLGAAAVLPDKLRTSFSKHIRHRFDRRLVRVRYNFLDGRHETLPPLPANTRVQMLLDIVRKDGTHCFANDVRGMGVGRADLFVDGNEERLEPHLTLAHCLLAGAAGHHVQREDASRAPFSTGPQARNHLSVADGSSEEGAACEQSGTTELNVFVTPLFYDLPAFISEARVDVCHCRDRPLVVHTEERDMQRHGDLRYKLASDERVIFPNGPVTRCGRAIFSFDESEWSARESGGSEEFMRKGHWDDTVVRFYDPQLRATFYSSKHRRPLTVWCTSQEEYTKYRVLFPKLAGKATAVGGGPIEEWGLRGPL